MKILFITHDASRTGAPIVLLHLLEWLKKNTSITPFVLMKDGGELENEFNSLAETEIWNREPLRERGRIKKAATNTKIINKYSVKLFKMYHQNKVVTTLNDFQPDLVYANTVVTSDIGLKLSTSLNCPLLCHVHELETAINRYFGKEKFLKIKHSVDYYIAVSNAVSQNLFVNHKIQENKIRKINPFIPALKNASEPKSKNSKRVELSIPQDAIVIGGCGTLDWRKSPDLFIHVANEVTKKNPNKNVYFVWVGGVTKGNEYLQLIYDINKLKLKNVLFIGTKDNPLEYFKIFDIFLLTSREDPYPLVCLEAASLSTPIVCFDGAGGMPEFVQQGCGMVVPFLDLNKMSEAVSALVQDDKLRTEIGRIACDKVIEQHDIEASSKKIVEFVKEIINKKLVPNE